MMVLVPLYNIHRSGFILVATIITSLEWLEFFFPHLSLRLLRSLVSKSIKDSYDKERFDLRPSQLTYALRLLGILTANPFVSLTVCRTLIASLATRMGHPFSQNISYTRSIRSHTINVINRC